MRLMVKTPELCQEKEVGRCYPLSPLWKCWGPGFRKEVLSELAVPSYRRVCGLWRREKENVYFNTRNP